MVKLRLTRFGKHKAPFYRIVATDSKTKRDGKYIALLGTYDPNKSIIKLKEDLILDFLTKGAQPSDTILNILKDHGIWAKYINGKKAKKKNKKRKLSAKRLANKKMQKATPEKIKPVEEVKQ